MIRIIEIVYDKKTYYGIERSFFGLFKRYADLKDLKTTSTDGISWWKDVIRYRLYTLTEDRKQIYECMKHFKATRHIRYIKLAELEKSIYEP